MGEQFANAIGTDPTLNGAISTTPASGTQETWTLSATGSGTSLPQSFPYMARVDDSSTTPDSPFEIVRITAHPSSTTITVLRGMDGTASRAHATGATFRHVVTSGGLNRIIGNRQLDLAPTGAIGETFPRLGTTLNTLASSNFISGRLHLTALWLPKDALVSSITYLTGGTGFTTPTNQWFALLNSSRSYLRSTSNDGSTAWAANTAKTLSLSSPLVIPSSGLYYVGIAVTAATMAAIIGVLSVGAGLNATELPPIMNGISSTGLTTPVADGTTAAAITGQLATPYAYVS